MEANQYCIYLFRVKETRTVIYVGSCKSISRRLNEHRRAFKESKRMLPIHKYMKEEHLELFKDVEVSVVEYLVDSTKEEALKIEAEYYYRYEKTLRNTRPAEIRTGKFATRNRPVKCNSDGKEFISIRQAAEYYGIVRNTLMNHLSKGKKLKSGISFSYINETDTKASSVYKVRCVEDRRFFSTYKGCCECYGMSQHQMITRFKDRNSFMFEGKTFERCNDYRKQKGA